MSVHQNDVKLSGVENCNSLGPRAGNFEPMPLASQVGGNNPDINLVILDDQNAPNAYAGQKVTVTGTLDAKTNTIHVNSIAAAK